jgi:peptide/nickel transport system permease protein
MSAAEIVTVAVPVTRRARRLPRSPMVVAAFAVLVVFAAFAIAPGVLATGDPVDLDVAHRLQAPAFAHPFGTDEGGRDVYTRVVWGARNSLGLALVVVLGGALLGVAFGAVSGMVGRRLDEAMMRFVDIFLAFPAFVLAMAVAAARGRGLSSLAIGLVIVWWPSYARLVRGEVLRLRERPHVEAARTLGMGSGRIFRRHILPFLWKDLNVRVTTDIGYALVAVTALSFLGLGAQSPTPEWGLLIRDSKTYVGTAWWYMAFPGLAIMLVTVASSIIGDWLAGGRDRSPAR